MDTKTRAIIARLFREFKYAAAVAIAWTAYTYWQGHDARTTIAAFASSFFLASWATGQFFRVQKQADVDKSFSTIEARLGGLLALLEQRTHELKERTEDLIGYATGSGDFDLFPTFMAGETNVLTLMAMNRAKYPVFDIHIEWIDLDEPGVNPPAGRFWTRHPINLPSLWPSKAFPCIAKFDLSSSALLRINFFISTRADGSSFQMRVAKGGTNPLIATKQQGPGERLTVQVPPNFPGLDPANPDLIFQ